MTLSTTSLDAIMSYLQNQDDLELWEVLRFMRSALQFPLKTRSEIMLGPIRVTDSIGPLLRALGRGGAHADQVQQ